MRILFVEDRKHDIGGILAQCIDRNWITDRVSDFAQAVEVLSDRSRNYDLVVVDIMLPWGRDTPDMIRAELPDELSGLTLLQAMRGVGIGHKVAAIMMRKSIEFHKNTPAIILSKVMEVEDTCRELGVLEFFDKFNYNFRSVINLIEKLEKHK
jgi:CheY-like chemotaxis protein